MTTIKIINKQMQDITNRITMTIKAGQYGVIDEFGEDITAEIYFAMN